MITLNWTRLRLCKNVHWEVTLTVCNYSCNYVCTNSGISLIIANVFCLAVLPHNIALLPARFIAFTLCVCVRCLVALAVYIVHTSYTYTFCGAVVSTLHTALTDPPIQCPTAAAAGVPFQIAVRVSVSVSVMMWRTPVRVFLLICVCVCAVWFRNVQHSGSPMTHWNAIRDTANDARVVFDSPTESRSRMCFVCVCVCVWFVHTSHAHSRMSFIVIVSDTIMELGTKFLGNTKFQSLYMNII